MESRGFLRAMVARGASWARLCRACSQVGRDRREPGMVRRCSRRGLGPRRAPGSRNAGLTGKEPFRFFGALPARSVRSFRFFGAPAPPAGTLFPFFGTPAPPVGRVLRQRGTPPPPGWTVFPDLATPASAEGTVFPLFGIPAEGARPLLRKSGTPPPPLLPAFRLLATRFFKNGRDAGGSCVLGLVPVACSRRATHAFCFPLPPFWSEPCAD